MLFDVDLIIFFVCVVFYIVVVFIVCLVMYGNIGNVYYIVVFRWVMLVINVMFLKKCFIVV